MSTEKLILGLDLGTNSVGWALTRESAAGELTAIVDLGCRIYPTVTEGKANELKNQQRRSARLMRRVVQRRARRKRKLLNCLCDLGLLPAELASSSQPEVTLNGLGDPYQLRAEALQRPLSKHELGRVLLHLGARRGFLSNRKTIIGDLVDDPDMRAYLAELEQPSEQQSQEADDKEEGKNLAKIQSLRAELNRNGQTLGQYLWQRVADGDLQPARPCRRNRDQADANLLTDRRMYQEEFAAICAEQSQHHPELDAATQERISSIIFYQRSLKLKADRLGKCSLERGLPRARLGRLECMRFRYLQDINNLQYLDSNRTTERRLSPEQRQQLYQICEQQASLSFGRIRKICRLSSKARFNLERSGTKTIAGNETACAIRKVIGERWDALSAERQIALVEDMLTIGQKSALKKRLEKHWRFSGDLAARLCLVELKSATSNLSLKAIRKLLPHLEQGMLYSEARVAAGYGYELESSANLDRLPLPEALPNPVVMRSLHELRRVVNAIVEQHGKPAAIRIEMARDLKMGKERKKTYVKQQKDNERRNKEAEAFCLENNLPSVYKNKLLYRLWQDQEQRCAYSNESISKTALFSGEIEIDHIIPEGLGGDDGYMNKVVCYRELNQRKGMRTPIDAFDGSREQWHQIQESLRRWCKSMPTKSKRFYQRAADLDDEQGFISSQLNDTRYICREAATYVGKLGCDVSVSKGALIARLRHEWGLNALLGDSNAKDRDDHRHHIIDAVVIATVNRSLYQQILRRMRQVDSASDEFTRLQLLDFKPAALLQLYDWLDRVIVSHAQRRKLSGALHEDTAHGFIEGKGTVYRARLNRDFKVNKVEDIVDAEVRRLVRDHLAKHGNDPKRAFADDIRCYHKDGKTPIHRVRVFATKLRELDKLSADKLGIKDRQGKIFKWMTYGNTHHVELVRDSKSGKVKGHFVTMYEAARRARGVDMPRQAMVRRDHGDGQEFLFALHKDDLVSIRAVPVIGEQKPDADDSRRLYMRVQILEATNNRMTLSLHTSAVVKKNKDQKVLSVNSELFTKWDLQKHQINVLGKLPDDQAHSRDS